MNGFSYINKISTACIHVSMDETFDIDDVEEIEKFRSMGGKIIFSDSSEDYKNTFENIIKNFDNEHPSEGLLKARLIDYLIESSHKEKGILLLIKCSMDGNGARFRNLLEAIEAILVSSNSWIKNNKPFHVVICDKFPSFILHLNSGDTIPIC